MFTVRNISNNSLPLSDKKRLASGESTRQKTIGDREKNYESRGWLSIIEDVKEEPKPAEKTEVKK